MWCNYHEDLLKKWSEMCSIYTIMHIKATNFYNWVNIFLGIPLVIISATVSFITLLSISFEGDILVYVGASVSFGLTILLGFDKFFGASDRSQAHFKMPPFYKKINMEIEELLSFPRCERKSPPDKFLQKIRLSINDLQENAPRVPGHITKKYMSFRRVKRTKVNKRNTYKDKTPEPSDSSQTVIEMEPGEQGMIRDLDGEEIEIAEHIIGVLDKAEQD